MMKNDGNFLQSEHYRCIIIATYQANSRLRKTTAKEYYLEVQLLVTMDDSGSPSLSVLRETIILSESPPGLAEIVRGSLQTWILNQLTNSDTDCHSNHHASYCIRCAADYGHISDRALHIVNATFRAHLRILSMSEILFRRFVVCDRSHLSS